MRARCCKGTHAPELTTPKHMQGQPAKKANIEIELLMGHLEDRTRWCDALFTSRCRQHAAAVIIGLGLLVCPLITRLPPQPLSSESLARVGMHALCLPHSA